MPSIQEQALQLGLSTQYHDAFGHEVHVSDETLAAIIAALQTEMPSAGLVPPCHIVTAGEAIELPLANTIGCAWRLTLEDGNHFDGGKKAGEESLNLPSDMPIGYHYLVVEQGGIETHSTIVVAPAKAFQPWQPDAPLRVWGLSAQLYGIRSARNWGIGDLSDLANLTIGAGRLGAAFVGINPLHALFPDEPENASPYSPSSRQYLNWLYLDIEAIPEFAESLEARILVESHEFQHELARLRAEPLVDYAGVAIAKRKVLELAYAQFRNTHLEKNDARDRAFTAYRRVQGNSLRSFALFHALREHLGANDWVMRDWANWPVELASPTAPGVAGFLAEQGERVEYYEYVQFLLDEQLAAARQAVRDADLRIGLYGDLAVGVDRGGAEAWANQQVVISALSIGAPPDPLAPHGQNWGLPLVNPAMLKQLCYEPYIRVIRAAMQRCGALRIDHILGLIRLYCIPNANPQGGGTYIQYPFEDLVRLLILESHRQCCLVIGEDLGTLPEGFRERLTGYGILSYRVLWFEQRGGEYVQPADYPAQALVTGGTHDLPTMLGFWENEDVKLRRELGLVAEEEMPAFLVERAREKQGVATLLHQAGLLPENSIPEKTPLLEIHRLIARTPCHLMTVQLDDALAQRNQANLPGTVNEYPNWRRKMPVDLQALFTDQTMRSLATVLVEEQRTAGKFVLPPPSTVNPRLAIPGSTYRLQFSADFTFDDATAIIPYLSDLGITHVYASSYLAARAGSTHGYDIIDHNALNPEIGNEESFSRYLQALNSWRMGQILDFVPNHMGVGKSDNQWWMDVLEWGQESPFAHYFDIDWQSADPALRNRVLVPVLGVAFGDAVMSGDLKLHFEPQMGSFSLWYSEHRFPLRPVDYAGILKRANRPELADLTTGFMALAKVQRGQRRSTAGSLKAEIVQLVLRDPTITEALQQAADSFMGSSGNRTTWRDFVALIERQNYRLASWRIAADEINYRRFFDINDLAGIRMEDPELFELTHRMIGRLVAQGALQGIRLDHIDGLYDPLDYLIRLYQYIGRFGAPADPRARGRERFYILVEKILAADEMLPQPWPVAGTTGYDFITELNGVFVDSGAEAAFDRLYREFTGQTETFDAIVETAKHLVIGAMLPSDLERLSKRLKTIADRDWNTRDFSLNRLRQALTEIVSGFQVYRTYITPRTTSAEDRKRLDQAVGTARANWLWPDTEIFDFLHKALTGDLVREPGNTYRKTEVFAFIQAFQQYTGPVMAKSLEDTSFYRYYRLASLNEVGNDPRQFGITVERFHQAAEARRSASPHSMLGSSTHDTKRGEDTRARINVLSELPAEWAALLPELQAIAAPFKTEGMPVANDEYLIYQTMLGIWSERTGEKDHLLERLQQYLTKALREGKEHSSWVVPNEPYEKATLDFAAALYSSKPFMDKLRPFARRVVKFGCLNGLSQTVLKLTAPGVPDVYQGSDLWNHSLADPDNRDKVDYDRRRQLLADSPPLATMLAEFKTPDQLEDGAIKIRLLQRLLRLRRGLPELFENGSYQPVAITGEHAGSLLGYTRRFGSKELLVVVGRLMVGVEATDTPPDQFRWNWGNTTLDLATHRWRDMLGANNIEGSESFAAADLFGALPVGVWVNEL